MILEGSRVRMKYFDGYAYGEVTIISELGVKVLFDGEFDLAYWYYPIKDLEKMPKYPVIEPMASRLENDYVYHAPKDDQPDRYKILRAKGKELAITICENTPSSREQSVALTLLDQVLMVANAAIARNE